MRVALGYDTLAGLHQQLGQVVAGLSAQSTAGPAAPKTEDMPAKKEPKH